MSDKNGPPKRREVSQARRELNRSSAAKQRAASGGCMFAMASAVAWWMVTR